MEDNGKEIKDLKNIQELVEREIEKITENGNQIMDLDSLSKLIDIHKDIANEDYWQKKKEVYEMRYEDYNDYGRRGVPGTGRGRYGRRGVPGTGRGRYRGHDTMEEMHDHYSNYSDASEEMYRGNYGAEDGMLKSVDGIMRNVCEIVEELAENENPEVMQIIKRYSRKISEMV